MRTSLLIVMAATLLAPAPAALASDGGHAKVDPKSLTGYANNPHPGDPLNGGLVACFAGCDVGLGGGLSVQGPGSDPSDDELAALIQAQLQQEQQQQQQEQQQILIDTQTKIFTQIQDVTQTRPKTSDKAFNSMDQYIQGYDGAGGDNVAYDDGGADGAGGDGTGG